MSYLVVVVAVEADGFTPDIVLPAAAPPEVSLEVLPDVLLPVEPAAGAPMELVLLPLLPPALVLPEPLVEVSVLAVPDVPLVVPAVLGGVLGDVVLGVVEDVGGAAASSRLVQAPSETAATSARAAHEVRDAFIGKLLE